MLQLATFLLGDFEDEQYSIDQVRYWNMGQMLSCDIVKYFMRESDIKNKLRDPWKYTYPAMSLIYELHLKYYQV
jgi:hypothetical protein